MASRVIRSSCKQRRTHPRSRLHETHWLTRINCARLEKLDRVCWNIKWGGFLLGRYRALYKLKLKKITSCFYLQDFRTILYASFFNSCWDFISQTTFFFYSSFYIRWQAILFCSLQVNWRPWIYCLYYVSYRHYG